MSVEWCRSFVTSHVRQVTALLKTKPDPVAIAMRPSSNIRIRHMMGLVGLPRGSCTGTVEFVCPPGVIDGARGRRFQTPSITRSRVVLTGCSRARTLFIDMTCLRWSPWKRDSMPTDAWSCSTTAYRGRNIEVQRRLALRPGVGNWTCKRLHMLKGFAAMRVFIRLFFAGICFNQVRKACVEGNMV